MVGLEGGVTVAVGHTVKNNPSYASFAPRHLPKTSTKLSMSEPTLEKNPTGVSFAQNHSVRGITYRSTHASTQVKNLTIAFSAKSHSPVHLPYGATGGFIPWIKLYVVAFAKKSFSQPGSKTRHEKKCCNA